MLAMPWQLGPDGWGRFSGGRGVKNRKPLSLRVPAPKHRPGDTPDFSGIVVPEAGAVPRPDIDARAHDIRELAYSLIRVLDFERPGGRSLGSAPRCRNAAPRPRRHAADARL